MQPTPVSPQQQQQMQSIARPTQDEKNLAQIVHFGSVVVPVILPLIVYLVKKDESKFVAFHALQVLFFSIASWIAITVFSTLTGGLAFFVLWLVPIAFYIVAGLKVNGGHDYEYPVVGKVARTNVYAA